ncbi:MAG TPA: GNAT family N-acyltransferase [Paracoccaceae bacterium]|nr:GNAT family N-acyltransferase [Paracoccaceae bacterium]
MAGPAEDMKDARRRWTPLYVGPYVASPVEDEDGLKACLALRREVFRKGQAEDRDRFDDFSCHVLLTDWRDDRPVACFRYRVLSARDLSRSYTAQFYDLTALAGQVGQMADLGRIAVTQGAGRGDPDLLRLLLAALTRIALAERVRRIFGCSSFAGADVARHAPALAWLRAHQRLPIAVAAWQAEDRPAALPDGSKVPPLLRSYLAMGAQVADEPVVDHALDTVHVFTALDLALIPQPRARSLVRLTRLASQGAT